MINNIIKSRRSNGKVLNKPVPQNVVENLLQAAAYAPTHKKLQPWRFVVFEGEGKQVLQQAWNTGAAAEGKSVEAIATKTDRAPTIIAVWCATNRGEKNVPVWEEHAAVSAAIQNMLLAAEEAGLAAIWRSGGMCEYPQVQELMKTPQDALDATKGDRIMGMIYIGYPDEAQQPAEQGERSVADKTIWVR